ncbi:hypothetical protein F1737_09005 [Methanoplanus sp. FWC-SCC4]|uniref:Uncharacterized protein n=1 Tax=Methanochimaera problematica TaxID=2609417 RepID=A0AA97FEJ0_9EURY|nr:hypothetical protein [Methanoplanus sp. FWC-SCC4]WOF16818.1 hypothetical protein F1737_09005 [Methanoplanus sp. FWC-SCC4]
MSNDVIEIGGKLEDWEPAKAESRFSVFKRKLGLKAAVAATAGAGLVASASAETTESINWTSIIEMINGAAGIFPSIGNMVINIAPVLILLGVVGFVLMFFNSILDAVRGAFNIFK